MHGERYTGRELDPAVASGDCDAGRQSNRAVGEHFTTLEVPPFADLVHPQGFAVRDTELHGSFLVVEVRIAGDLAGLQVEGRAVQRAPVEGDATVGDFAHPAVIAAGAPDRGFVGDLGVDRDLV